MIVQELSGGLGNQMFQYAFARALALRQGGEVALYWSDEKCETRRELELPAAFHLKAKLLSAAELSAFLGWQHNKVLRKVLGRIGCRSLLSRWLYEPHYHYAAQLRQVPDGSFLRGYWQSEKYFADNGEAIRRDFQFKTPLSPRGRLLEEQIRRTGETAVSLHVRCGDYLSSAAVRNKHGNCPLDFYSAAVAYLAARVPTPRFYLFSDDLDWVQRHLQIPFPHLFVEPYDGGSGQEDMHLMSMCRHHIIANSTFSWWGAWLNPSPEKIVVAPQKWFADGTSAADLLPPEWVRL